MIERQDRPDRPDRRNHTRIKDYERMVQKVEERNGIFYLPPSPSSPSLRMVQQPEPAAAWHRPAIALTITLSVTWAGWLAWEIFKGIRWWLHLTGRW